jgi:hypothetical protein
MKAVLSASLIFLGISTSFSQEKIIKIQVPEKKTPEEIQIINFEDELFVTYKIDYLNPKTKPYFFYSIDKEGIHHETDFAELNGKIISSITSDSLQNYFHYIEDDNKSISLGAIKRDRLTGKKTSCAPTTIDGRLLGITANEERLFIYSFEKKTYQLRVTEKINDKLVTEKLYPLSFDFSKFKRNDIAFIPEGSVIGAEQASVPVKIFVGSNYVRIVFDDPFNEFAPVPQNNYRTILIDINTKTGDILNRSIVETSKGNFRSFPLSNYLTRAVVWGNDFTLQVFDIKKGKLVNSKKIVNEKTNKDQMVFFREGNKNIISRNENLFHMIKVAPLCVPFVLAEKDPLTDNGLLVTWGTYYNSRGAMGPGMGGPAGLLVMAVGTTIKQMSEGPGVSRYFYLRGSAEDEFQIISDGQVDIVRNKIDSFEMTHLSGDVRRMGYYQASASIIAVYHNKPTSEMWLIEF